MSFLGGILKTVAAPLVGGALGIVGNSKDNKAASSAARVANEFTEKNFKIVTNGR